MRGCDERVVYERGTPAPRSITPIFLAVLAGTFWSLSRLRCENVSFHAGSKLAYRRGIVNNKKIVKLYAAYRSGCLGDNIFHAYFPFLANIISQEKWDYVDEAQVAEKFRERYAISLPLAFVRQVLGVGVEKQEILYDRGKYVAQRAKFRSYSIDSSDFDLRWGKMLECFIVFCSDNEFDLTDIDTESNVFRYFDVYDEAILTNDELYMPEKSDAFNYIWHCYLNSLSETNSELFDFVVAISFSNILKDVVFYSSDTIDPKDTYNGLVVYLDSPMVFALLGTDSDARIESCKLLVSGMINAGCSVQVFSHNFDEIKGIIERAAGWATSVNYDISKANNVSKYFHDVLVEAPAIAEFCESVEENLNEMGITIKDTSYDVTQDEFQEDEQALYNMIEARYTHEGRTISDEKKKSILVDVRSIIMVYRERRGQLSTKIQSAGHIMITLNGAIANVSKNFESSKSINAGHIPPCVSADIFGSILWLFSPIEIMKYQRKQLLADCHIALHPSKEMLQKYMESLERARNADEIDEKKFLFMRAHKAVNDALMDVTKGDYARFNDQTYLEVYDDIVAKADKKYNDEASAHTQTRKRLEETEKEKEQLRKENDDLVTEQKARKDEAFKRKCNFWGWIATIVVIGIPYIVVVTIIEITKSVYSTLSFSSLLHVGLLMLATIVTGVLFAKGKAVCFEIVRRHLFERRSKDE